LHTPSERAALATTREAKERRDRVHAQMPYGRSVRSRR
jgi:hypothetical protein